MNNRHLDDQYVRNTFSQDGSTRHERSRRRDGESGGGQESAAPGAARSGVPLRRDEEGPAVPRLDAVSDSRSLPGLLFQP